MAGLTHKSAHREGAGLFLSLVLLLAAVLACSSGSSPKCTATLTYDGRTYEGADSEADKAKHNACNKYCRADDPEYDAMYRIWLDSPAGRAAGRPSKEEAIFKDKRLLDYVTRFSATSCRRLRTTRQNRKRLPTKTRSSRVTRLW